MMAEKRSALPMKDVFELTSALTVLKFEAGRLGLYKTMHSIDLATIVVGWETADKRLNEPHEFVQDNNSQTYVGKCGRCGKRLKDKVHV